RVADGGRRLERRVTAKMHAVANAQPLKVAASPGADDGLGIERVGDSDARLDVGPDGGVVGAVKAMKALVVGVVQDIVRNVSLRRIRKAAAGDHDAIEEIAPSNESCNRIDGGSGGWVIAGGGEDRKISPPGVIGLHDAVANAVLDDEIRL